MNFENNIPEPSTETAPPEVLREHSRGESPSQRSEVAQAIREQRAAYHQRRHQLLNDIQALQSRSQDIEEAIAGITAEMNTEDQESAQWTARLIKTFERLYHRMVRSQDDETPLVRKQRLEQEYQEVHGLMTAMQRQREDNHELSRAKELLRSFYTGQAESWRRYQEDQRIRSIEAIAKEHGVLVLHGIKPVRKYFNGALTVLRPDTNWKTRFKIAVAMEPTVSAFTIRDGETSKHLYSDIGLVIGKGRVQSAFPQDGFTAAEKVKQRTGSIPTEQIQASIHQAIHDREGTYNEFVVDEMVPVGLYYSMDSSYSSSDTTVYLADVRELARELGLPVYLISKGKAYTDDQTTENVPVAPEEMTHQKEFVSEERKNEIIRELFEDSPFKVGTPEYDHLTNCVFGKNFFVTTHIAEYRDQYLQRVGVEDAPGDDQEKVLIEVPLIDARLRYVLRDDGGVEKRRQTGVGTEHGLTVYRSLKNWEQYYPAGSQPQIDLFGVGLFPAPKEMIVDDRTFFAAVSEAEQYMRKSSQDIVTEQKRRGLLTDDWKKHILEGLDKNLTQLAYFVYGYGQQSKEFGLEEVNNEAVRFASQYIPLEQFQEVVTRRTGKNGGFKITEADLP